VIAVIVPVALLTICSVKEAIMFIIGRGVPAEKHKDGKARHLHLIDIQSSTSGASRLIWNDALECGIKAIDAQHRQLFEAGNALLESVRKNPSGSDATSKAQILVETVTTHFKSEESLLAAWNHPLTEDHKAVHESLLSRTNELLAKSRNGTLAYQLVFKFLVDDLVYEHIAAEDRRFLFPN
jgi:hemerythrin